MPRTRSMIPRNGTRTRAATAVSRVVERESARAQKRATGMGLPGTGPTIGVPVTPIGPWGPGSPPPGVTVPPSIITPFKPPTVPPQPPPVPAGPVSPPPGAPTTPIGAGAAGIICEQLPPVLREACYAAGGWVEGQLVGGAPGGGNGAPPSMPSCPSGTVRIGDACVSPGDVFPGGAPFTSAAGGQAVQGGFGLPALTPVQESRIRRRCPDGFVLGKDNLCYPRQILPRRSKFRKWRPAARPAVTAGDVKAIRRADRARRRLVELTKDAGAHASLTRPRRK